MVVGLGLTLDFGVSGKVHALWLVYNKSGNYQVFTAVNTKRLTQKK